MSCDDPPSPFQVVSGTSLRISPNLEALLQHDELTRGSPTNLYHPISGFAVSLPPPPPRNNIKKVSHPETRVNLKEIRRKTSVNIRSDSWPDALPACSPPVGHSSPAPSRCATPNPFINPTPTINTSDSALLLPPPRRSEPDVRRAPPVIIPPTLPSSSHRSSPTLHRVEKMFSKGRESLSILTSAAIPSSLKLKQDDHIDRRLERTQLAEMSANQSSLSMSQVRQGGGSENRTSMSHQSFETPTSSNVFPMIPGTQQQWSPATVKCSLSIRPHSAAISPSASTRSLPPESSISPSAMVHSEPPSASFASSLPHLPPISPIEMPSLQEQSNNGSRSFIDFFSPPSPLFQDTPNDISILPARRPSAPAVLSSSMNSSTPYNNSPLDDLPSMVFAPPSPFLPNECPPSPVYSRPSSSLSSYSDISAMIFAPGSPTSGPPLSPTFHRHSSSHSSVSSVASPDLALPSLACPDTLKPPIPTATKPLFERRGRKVRLQKRSMSSSPQPPITRLKVPLPPTTNKLRANERADLIRRNRKLVQLLGQTPGEMHTSGVEEPRLFKMLPQPAFSALLGSMKQKHNHRHAMSVSVAVKTPGLTEPSSSWQVLDRPPSSSGRRHSTPYTPRSFTLYLDNPLDPRDTRDHHGPHHHWNIASSTSFIDLSDEDISYDASDMISIETANKPRNSSSTPSLLEALSPEERAEAAKRRKRDKLAKLHRFLGSRVPTDLVVGHIAGPSLPPASTPDDCRDMWLYRRMSAASSFERVKDELDVEEKALNVKRAQKMEKLFGTPPPQTLYHTRHAPATVARSQPTSPVSSVMVPHYLSDDSTDIPRRNPNQTAYMKGKKTHRPRTSESTTYLLPSKSTNTLESPPSYLDAFARSSVYMDYQHSIASLTDIIERDDRESLAELHRFLHGEMVESPTDEQPLLANHRLSTSTYSHKSERRHSLPTRTSMTSISTELVPPSKPEPSDFQLRRRRAAKLTHFFGVDYCELIHDILESIEKGVEEERKRGTLRPEEVESLLHRLHNLRMRRNGFL